MARTRHPEDGVLRRLLDEPAGVSDPDRAHIAACGRCQQALTAARDDAAAASALLGAPAAAATPPGDDVDSAWQRLRGSATAPMGDTGQVSFTFSAAKAAASAQEAGGQLPPVPAGLDGSVVRLTAGPGVAATWSSSAGAPALVVGRAVAPTAESTGAPFTQVRDYLLSLPGIPADLASQLAVFPVDGRDGAVDLVLPLPVPADRATTSTADVDGAPATVVRANDGTMAAVVWVSDGVVTAVAGTSSTDELLDVARGLR